MVSNLSTETLNPKAERNELLEQKAWSSQNSEIESCPCDSVSHACDTNANDLLALSDGIQGHIANLLLCMGNLLDFPEHPVAECVLQTSRIFFIFHAACATYVLDDVLCLIHGMHID